MSRRGFSPILVVVIIALVFSGFYFFKSLNMADKPALETVKIFLVALDDNGQKGKMIGCQDSLVAVERQVETSGNLPKAALEELLSIKQQVDEPTGYYNSLANANLAIGEVSAKGDEATVLLSGQLMLGGVCDSPRVQAQLEETVLQFPQIKRVEILLNGRPLDEELSDR